MTFSLYRDTTVSHSVVRIGREQIRLAIQEIEDPALDRHVAIHEVRKRCKKLRALLRLVQPALGSTYRRENACFRDAAKSLSYLRDAQTLVDCFDDVAARFEEDLNPALILDLRRQLLERRDRVAEDRGRLEECLQAFLVTLRDAGDRLPGWTVSELGFAAVAGGLRKTYKRGRKAMQAAYAEPTTERFHDWRKSAKYHAHHLRLVRPLWKPVLSAQQRQAERLAELLGNDHDLDVLRQALLADPAAFGEEHRLQPLFDVMDKRHQELRRQAHVLGGRVFAERPNAFIARIAEYWYAWGLERAHNLSGKRPKAAGAAIHPPRQLHRVG